MGKSRGMLPRDKLMVESEDSMGPISHEEISLTSLIFNYLLYKMGIIKPFHRVTVRIK